MGETELSWMIVLFVAALVAAVFVLSSLHKKNQQTTLMAYCTAHGWSYTQKTERLHASFTILGAGWQLESGITVSSRSSECGSSDQFAYTRWASTCNTYSATPIHFGIANGATLPDLYAASPMLGALMATTLAQVAVPHLRTSPTGSPFALFITPDTPEDVLGQPIETLLAAWPKGWPLHGCLCSQGATLDLSGKRLQTAQELSILITLGQAINQRFGAQVELDPATER